MQTQGKDPFATPFEQIGGEDKACMERAMSKTGVDDALRARLRDSFFQTADCMRNAPA